LAEILPPARAVDPGVLPEVTERVLLAVHAHPDDESSKGAGTFARYADEGVRTVIVTLTGGEAGEILNPAMDRPGNLERMPELRREELAKALEILKVGTHHWLGYRDSGMPDTETNAHPDALANADLDEAVGRLVAVLRAERPQVVLCYDETGGYPHPDHIRDHELTVAAVDAAADPARYPDAGPPWSVLKLYYFATFSRRRLELMDRALVERGIESPFADWLARWEEFDRPEPEVTAQIDVAKWLPQAREALIAHATQIDPNSFWFAIPNDVLADVYPWEDYSLARSLVPAGDGAGTGVDGRRVETDLFDGID
jgi:mycothiol S-conjugate amidase